MRDLLRGGLRTARIDRSLLLVFLIATAVPALAAPPDVVIADPVATVLETTADRTVVQVEFPVAELNVSWAAASQVVWTGLVTEDEDTATRERRPLAPEYTAQIAVAGDQMPHAQVLSERWHREPQRAVASLVSLSEPVVYRGVPLVGLAVKPTAGDGILAAIVVAIEHPAPARRVPTPSGRVDHPTRQEFVPRSVLNQERYRLWREVAADQSLAADRSDSADKATSNDAFALSGNWVRVEVDTEGVHRLSGADLEAAGLVLATIDPTKVRLFRGGGLELGENPVEVENDHPERTGLNELAVQLRGMDDLEWNVDDDLIFYGHGAHIWTDRLDPTAARLDRSEHSQQVTGVYWLTWENDTTPSPFAGGPLRIASVAAPASGGDPVTTHTARVHHEETEAYVGGWLEDAWAWDAFINGQFSRTFEVEALVPDASAEFWMEVSGLYTTRFGSRFEVRGYFNDDLGNAVAHDWTHGQWVAAAGVRFGGTTGALTRGANTVRLRYDNYDFLDAFVAFDAFQLEYPATLDKRDYQGELICALWGDDVPAPDTPVDVTFTLAGIADYQLWDITDPLATVRLQGDETAGATRTVTVGLSQDPDQARHLMLFLEGDLRPVTSAVRVAVEPLRESVADVDYIVIHPAAFASAAGELAALRSRVLPGVANPRAAAVSIEDVYANFSGGQKDWRAVRQFLRWHYYQHGQRLRWVCLLGDASIDYRNIYGREPGAELYDWVPTQLITNFPSIQYPTSINEPYTADEALVALDAPPVGQPYFDIPDLAIGRLPARSASDATALVQRVIDFVENPPAGDWVNRVLISADDLRRSSGDPASAEEDHTIQAERLARQFVPTSIDIQKLYLLEYPVIGVYKPDGRRDLLSMLSDGTTMFYYVGHGAAETLADEHLFQTTDISGLANGGKRFVFMAFSCDVGVFADPNSQCMAEDFLTASQGGGIAAIAASWVSYSNFNDILGDAVFAHYYPDRSVSAAMSVGEALTAGKAEMWTGTFVWNQVRNARRYNVMGDPAIRPPHPVDDLTFTTASSDSLLTGRLHNVEPALESGGMAYGAGTTYRLLAEESKIVRQFVDFNGDVHDYFSTPQPVFRGQGALSEPGLGIPFLAPQSMRIGEHGRIRVIVDDGSGLPRVAAIAMPVVQVPASSGGDVAGPAIDLAFTGNRIRVEPGAQLEAAIIDTSGVNIVATNPANSVLLEFDRSGIYNNVSADVEFESGSYTRARLSTQLPGDLAIGDHVVVMTASDMFGNVGSDTLSFTLAAGGVGAMLDATVFPNPTVGPCRMLADLTGPMSLQWDIYTVSGRRIQRIEGTFDSAGPAALAWDGRDQEGDRIANGVYLYVLRGRMPGDEHEYRETGQLVIMQ